MRHERYTIRHSFKKVQILAICSSALICSAVYANEPQGSFVIKAGTVLPVTADGTPAYCGENLKWRERSWTPPPSQRDLFPALSRAFYRMLHRTLTQGAPLEITPQQVRRQIAVIEACQRQNPDVYAKRG